MPAPDRSAPSSRREPAEGGIAPADKRRILNRLKRLEGQVRGLQRMIDEERSCHEILTLLSGVRSALDATGDAVLENYLDRCATDLATGETDVAQLLVAVKLARG